MADRSGHRESPRPSRAQRGRSGAISRAFASQQGSGYGALSSGGGCIGAVAGGMFSGRGPTLEERSRKSGIGTISQEAAAVGARRHCWVAGPAQDPGPHPGLVLDWTHQVGGWSALVVYVMGEAVLQEWVGVDQLRPA